MKNWLRVASVCLLMLFASEISFAQKPTASATPQIERLIGWEPPCPTISVSCPSNIEVGKPVEFIATIGNLDPKLTPTYTWEVVGGVIENGQGTTAIKVNIAENKGQTITATLTVGGLDLACSRTASCSNSNCRMSQTPKDLNSSAAGSISQNEARLNRVAAAQPSASPPQQSKMVHESCPSIGVSCPSDVEVGKLQVFKASVSDPNAKLSYKWEVVGGQLIEGQGTPEIKVKLIRRLEEGVVATLRVCGLDPTCATTASCSTAIRQTRLPAAQFDSYTFVANKQTAQLDIFAIALIR